MNTSSDVGKQVVIRFLRNYSEFGCQSHLLTAKALEATLSTSDNQDTRKILAVRIFAELMSALEDLGAISIAIRHRDEGVGLVYSLLTYGNTKTKLPPPTTLKQIFEILKQGDGLMSGLLLPSKEVVLNAFPLSSRLHLSTQYQEVNLALAQAASTYLIEERALVRAYNKTKHGFLVVSDRHTFQTYPPNSEDDIAWIADKNSKYDPDNPLDTPVVELFDVRVRDVNPNIDRIAMIKRAVEFVATLTMILLEKEIITSADSKA